MIRTFVQTKEFSHNWDNLGLDDDDLRRLEQELLTNPSGYPVIVGTGGLRKARFAFSGRGKRGSVRVCYVDFVMFETIYLITAYSKNEKDNLTMSERNAIRQQILLLQDSLKGES